MTSSQPFFVIFNLGIAGRIDPDIAEPRKIEYDLANVGIIVRAVYVVKSKRLLPSFVPHSNNLRYAFWITQRQNERAFAQRIVDALFATITLLYQTDLSRSDPFDQGPTAYPVPQRFLKHRYFLKHSDLIRHDPGLQFRLGYCSSIPEFVVKTAWKMLPVVVEEPYFDAIHFYQASIRDFCFLGDTVTAVIYGDITQPVSRSEFARAEDAILNAFKAVEAIVGDFPKDDRKFHRKLRDVGIDPDEIAGYVGRGIDSAIDKREPISEKLRRMAFVRDKKAAHGLTKVDRRITYFEIMDFQACAKVVLQVAIEKKLGWQNGS